MTMLDVSIVNVALPSIEGFLGASATHIQWIVSGYSLTFGLALIPSGRLGDVLGRRNVFLIGLVGFVAASLMCGLSRDSQWLVVMRILQGVFAGIVNPQVMALIQELFSGKERARAFGLFGMTIGISTAIGPLLGGVLVSALGPEYGWRSVFLINVPIGLIVVPFAFAFLPSKKRAPAPGTTSQRRWDFDLPGIVLIGVGVLAVMLPFVSIDGSAGFAGAPWWLLIVAAVVFTLVALWERHYDAAGRNSVLPPVLLRNKGFMFGTLFGFAYFAGFTSVFVVATMYFQNGLGTPAWLAGIAQMPFAIGSGIASVIAGRILPRVGRPVVVFGNTVLIIGVLAAAFAARFAGPNVAIWLIPACLLVAGVGSGTTISSNQTLTLEAVPVSESGTASGLLQTVQRLGASIGLALITTVFFTISANHSEPSKAAVAAASGRALWVSLLVIALILAIALAVAFQDMRRRRR